MRGKRIITVLDQCTSTEMIWPEGQEKFIGKITCRKMKIFGKAALKYLSWVIKPGRKFLKDSKHTPCVFGHLHLIMLFNACNPLNPVLLLLSLLYILYLFRRHFDSQWLTHSIILFKRNKHVTLSTTAAHSEWIVWHTLQNLYSSQSMCSSHENSYFFFKNTRVLLKCGRH